MSGVRPPHLQIRYYFFNVEIEIHNRNFCELDARMKFLLGGWPDCLIGIAVKYFPRQVDVYYKRDGVVTSEKVVDVGTIELSVAHQVALRNVSEDIEIKAPGSEERCRIVPSNDEGEDDTLETTNPDFYRITLDSDLLYLGTEFADVEDERPKSLNNFTA